jgi:hypothetical protein
MRRLRVLAIAFPTLLRDSKQARVIIHHGFPRLLKKLCIALVSFPRCWSALRLSFPSLFCSPFLELIHFFQRWLFLDAIPIPMMIFFGNKRIAIPAISALSTLIYLLVFWRTNAAATIVSTFQRTLHRVPSAAGQACDCGLHSSQRDNDEKAHQAVIEKEIIVSTTQACAFPTSTPPAVASTSETAAAVRKYKYAVVMAHILDYSLYNEALKVTESYCETHGYDLKVLRQNIMGDFYTKTVQVFSVIAQELAKPEGERLEWLL